MRIKLKERLANRLLKYVSYNRLKDEIIRRDIGKAYRSMSESMIEEFYKNV